MKKDLFLLFALLCTVTFFASCKDDEKPEVPPTVEDVVAEYSADKLSVKVDGVATSDQAKVELVKSGDESLTIKLVNIVPGVKEVSIPNATFEATTRSMYVSKLTGKVKDNVSGYDVTFDGIVDEGVLTAQIGLSEIKNDTINTSELHGLVYKGNMEISVAGAAAPAIEQRVYIEKAYSIRMNKRDTAMVRLKIKNFDFQGLVLGEIKLDTILIQKRGDVLAFKAADRKIKLESVGEVTANLQGTIIGDAMNLNLDIDASSLKVNVDFKGGEVVESQTVNMEEMTIEGAAIVGQEKEASSLTLKIWEGTPAENLLLTPKYKVSDKGTVEYILLHVSGQEDIKLSQDQIDGKKPIDFSVLKSKDDYIKYHMNAEDPNVTKDFIIYVEQWSTNMIFDMKDWVDGNPKGLISSNGAATLLPFMTGKPLPEPGLPVTKASDGVARITSFKTESNYGSLVPAITAGTLFSGDFEIDMNNTLKSTKFGVPYNKKPVNFKFTYKYTPGEILYKHKLDGKKGVAEVVDGKDECSIAAYLYEVSDYNENLDGTNINNSNKVILRAVLTDGTAKSDYQEKTVPFEEIGNGSYDASKKYKLAIVCTPSKWGDQFMGAELSSLYIKYLEVTSK